MKRKNEIYITLSIINPDRHVPVNTFFQLARESLSPLSFSSNFFLAWMCPEILNECHVDNYLATIKQRNNT